MTRGCHEQSQMPIPKGATYAIRNKLDSIRQNFIISNLKGHNIINMLEIFIEYLLSVIKRIKDIYFYNWLVGCCILTVFSRMQSTDHFPEN